MKKGLFFLCLLFAACQKEQPAIVKDSTNSFVQLGDPVPDSVYLETANRIDDPQQPAPNWVKLANATVTSYTVDFTWIWGITNKKHGGGNITLGVINVLANIKGHGFSISSVTYTTFPGSSLVTIYISGNSTTIKPNPILSSGEVIIDPNIVYIKTVLNINNGNYSMEVSPVKK